MEATIGGTKRHLLDLAAASDRSSFQFEVACPRVRSEPRGDTSFFDDMSALDVQLHVVPMTRAIRPIDDWRATWALLRLIHRGRYDIVHTHSTKAGVVGRVAAMLAPGARIVHTPHGFYFLNFASPIARAPLRWLEAMLGRATSALIALSEGERQVAGEIVQPGKVRKIPLTFAPFEPVPRAEAADVSVCPLTRQSSAPPLGLPTRRRRSTLRRHSPRSTAGARTLGFSGPTTVNCACRWRIAFGNSASTRQRHFRDL